MGKKIDDVKQFLENNGINAYRKFDDGLVYKDKHNGHIYSIYYELLDEHLDNNCSIILGDVSSNIQNKITILRKINDINKDNFIYNIYISDDNCLVILFSYMCPVEFFDAESFLQYTVDHINNLKKKDFFGLTQYIDNVSNNNINDTSKNVNNNNNGYMINFKRNWTYSSLVEDLHNTSDRLKEDLNEALEINDKQKKLETLKKLQEHYNSAEINDLFNSRAHDWMYDNNPSHDECMVINNYITSYQYSLIDIADSIRYLSNEEVDNDEDNDDEYDEYEDDDDIDNVSNNNINDTSKNVNNNNNNGYYVHKVNNINDISNKLSLCYSCAYFDRHKCINQNTTVFQKKDNDDSFECFYYKLLDELIFCDKHGNTISAISNSADFLEKMYYTNEILACKYNNSHDRENTAYNLVSNSDWNNLLNYCDGWLKEEPLNHGAYNLRGLAKSNLNFKPEQVIKDYARAIRLYPFEKDYYGNLAKQYYRLGDKNGAKTGLNLKLKMHGEFSSDEQKIYDWCNTEANNEFGCLQIFFIISLIAFAISCPPIGVPLLIIIFFIYKK